MGVSSHLTPEPEHRLWLIHGNLLRCCERGDVKLLSLSFLCAAQIALVRYAAPAGAFSVLSMCLLAAALPLALAAVSPFVEAQRQLPLLDPSLALRRQGDSLISAVDIAKYPQVELVVLLDRYLGGGITATPYYEDIIAQIILSARIVTRKRRLLAAACVLAGTAQLCLLLLLAAG
jgi:hypothetical protein